MKNSNRYSFPLLLKSIRRVLSGLKRNTIREHYPSRNVLSTYLKFHYYTCPVNENYSHPSVWIGNGKHGGESVLQRDKFACMNLPAPPACRNKDKRSLELKKLFPTRVYIRMRFSAVETQQQSPLPIHFYSFFDFILLKSMPFSSALASKVTFGCIYISKCPCIIGISILSMANGFDKNIGNSG